jgi:hypothetical protein
MSDPPARNWRYLGSARVTANRRIKLPPDVFELGILPRPTREGPRVVAADESDPPEETGTGTSDAATAAAPDPVVYWGYDSADGTLIASDAPLRNDPEPIVDGEAKPSKYKTPHTGHYVVDDNESHYRVTIAPEFFEDTAPGPDALDTHVPPYASVARGEERHFVTAEAFLESTDIETDSMYLLKRTQLEGLLGDFGGDNPHLPDQPRFV